MQRIFKYGRIQKRDTPDKELNNLTYVMPIYQSCDSSCVMYGIVWLLQVECQQCGGVFCNVCTSHCISTGPMYQLSNVCDMCHASAMHWQRSIVFYLLFVCTLDCGNGNSLMLVVFFMQAAVNFVICSLEHWCHTVTDPYCGA